MEAMHTVEKLMCSMTKRGGCKAGFKGFYMDILSVMTLRQLNRFNDRQLLAIKSGFARHALNEREKRFVPLLARVIAALEIDTACFADPESPNCLDVDARAYYTAAFSPGWAKLGAAPPANQAEFQAAIERTLATVPGGCDEPDEDGGDVYEDENAPLCVTDRPDEVEQELAFEEAGREASDGDYDADEGDDLIEVSDEHLEYLENLGRDGDEEDPDEGHGPDDGDGECHDGES